MRTPNTQDGSPRPLRFRPWLPLALLLFAAATSLSAARGEQRASQQLTVETMELTTATGLHRFEVELAETEEQRRVGLMNRQEMAADRGMLFDFKTEQVVLMWMKNTYISLDMVFFSRDGRVVSIAKRTRPLSETIISSQRPAYAVLELVGGAAEQIGLAVGDRASHRIFAR